MSARPVNELVVARYAEDLGWVARVPDDFAVTIYNKGVRIADAAVSARARIVARENVGRESETYLQHVLDMGAPGDGFTAFVQGDPFEHSPDFPGLLAAWRAWEDIQPLSWRWRPKRNIPPLHILGRETEGFVDGLRVRPELFSLVSWAPLGFYDPGTQWLDATYRAIHRLDEGSSIASHFLRKCGLEELAAEADRHRLGRFAYGAVFAARQSRLKTLRPEQLALLRRAALGHQVYGYVLERLWLHLFGAGFVLPTAAPERPMESTEPGFVPLDTTRPAIRRLGRVARRIRRALTRS